MKHNFYKFYGKTLLLMILTGLFLTACADNNTSVPNPTTEATVTSILSNASLKNLKVPTSTPETTPAVVPFTGWTGKGTIQDQYFFSQILQRRISYRIYLPPGYAATPGKHYPVLYMLHGLSGSYQEWVDYGLPTYLDERIWLGGIQPFIIVLPLGEQGYWMNHANNGPRWADYVAYDVVNNVDTNYRTLAQPQNRAIGGHSMGGHGALQIGFNYPQVFGIIGAHSPTLRTRQNGYDYFGDALYFQTVDPVSLAETKDLSNTKLWIDIGDKDTEWLPRAQELRKVLDDRKVSFTWNVWPGEHAGEYWIEHVKDYVNFYDSAFAFEKITAGVR